MKSPGSAVNTQPGTLKRKRLRSEMPDTTTPPKKLNIFLKGTAMSKIKQIKISQIDPNPHRDIGTFPFSEKKLKTLEHSIDHIGLWEGVIARPAGDRYQLAFGHHRLEAARLSGMKSIPLIVKDLDDEKMLQYMGAENNEDYSADFVVMLETWFAAKKHLEKWPLTAATPQVVDEKSVPRSGAQSQVVEIVGDGKVLPSGQKTTVTI